jgi:hypothetical protein
MKITIEPTKQIVIVHGIDSRRWLGTTEQGIKCDVFISLIRVADVEDSSVFERELKEVPDPTDKPIDLRMLI